MHANLDALPSTSAREYDGSSRMLFQLASQRRPGAADVAEDVALNLLCNLARHLADRQEKRTECPANPQGSTPAHQQ